MPRTDADPRAAFADLIASEYRNHPPIAAKIFATLLTADEPSLTAAQLAGKLSVSAGSVSTMTHHLERSGMIERVRRPGERADHFRAVIYSSAMIDSMVAAMTRITRLVDEIPAELSEEAVKRVRALFDVYTHVADLLRGPGGPDERQD